MKPVKSLVFIISPSTSAADLNRIMLGICAFSDWLKSELRLIHLSSPEQLDHLVDIIGGYCSDLALLHDSDAYRDSGFDLLGLLERLVIPVLLLPKKFSFSPLAKSILVPLEGQNHISRSLEFALTLAEQTKSHVDIVHVTGHPIKDGQILEAIGDQMHHEFHEELERITAEASPFSTVEERRWIRTCCFVRDVRRNRFWKRHRIGKIRCLCWSGPGPLHTAGP